MCIMFASMMRHKEERGFHKLLSELFKLNNLPSVSFGDMVPPVFDINPGNMHDFGNIVKGSVGTVRDNEVKEDDSEDLNKSTSSCSEQEKTGRTGTKNKKKKGNESQIKKPQDENSQRDKHSIVMRTDLSSSSTANNDSPVAAGISKFSGLKYQATKRGDTQKNVQKYSLRNN